MGKKQRDKSTYRHTHSAFTEHDIHDGKQEVDLFSCSGAFQSIHAQRRDVPTNTRNNKRTSINECSKLERYGRTNERASEQERGRHSLRLHPPFRAAHTCFCSRVAPVEHAPLWLSALVSHPHAGCSLVKTVQADKTEPSKKCFQSSPSRRRLLVSSLLVLGVLSLSLSLTIWFIVIVDGTQRKT